jgi:dimethylglycine dehydrogenase
MGRFLVMEGREFTGKAATLAAPERPLRIAMVELAAHSADAMGAEPVFHGGECVGLTTSGGYGHRVQKSLAFVCVPPALAAAGTALTVQVQGEMLEATVLAEPPYDPSNARMRA